MKAKKVNETLRIKNNEFKSYDLGSREKVWAGEDGILGKNNTLIPWEFIDDIMKNYRR